MNLAELEGKSREDLLDMARDLGIQGAANLKKHDLMMRVLQGQSETQGNVMAGGVLDIVEDGYGFLRHERMLPGPSDVYVSQSQVRRFALRTGDYVTGQVRPPKDGEKYFGLLRVEEVNGQDPEAAKRRPHFD